jgi:hypothetical protein
MEQYGTRMGLVAAKLGSDSATMVYPDIEFIVSLVDNLRRLVKNAENETRAMNDFLLHRCSN